jgi:polyisoprenoid-binding protein YceI
MTWRFGPVHSEVRWTCTYLGVVTVMGLFRDVRATLCLEGQDVSRWSVDVTILAASVDSGNALRDEILRGPDFLDVARFPFITFRSTGVERGDSHYRVLGNLTIHEVTREVALDLQDLGEVVDLLGQRSRVLIAETTLKRTDFHIGPPPQAGATIGSDVRISLQVELLRENDTAQLVGSCRHTDAIPLVRDVVAA